MQFSLFTVVLKGKNDWLVFIKNKIKMHLFVLFESDFYDFMVFYYFCPTTKKLQFINRKFFIVLKSLENIDHSEVSPLQFKSIHKNL